MPSFLRRLFQREASPPGPAAQFDAIHLQVIVEQGEPTPLQTLRSDPGLVELHIVGESYRQDALAAVSGPKGTVGKEMPVEVTLRCEPTNQYDEHAIRVEVTGQHVGYVARDQAALLCKPLTAASRGVIEAQGLIVGGWRDGDSEGHYGIRVWITRADADRLGIKPEALDPSLRPALPWPTLPTVQQGERRLSPTAADIDAEHWGAEVTVTCEEHYQATILAAMPEGWDNRSWPLLVDLRMAPSNPHAKAEGPWVEIGIAESPIGFFTPAMTERYRALVEETAAAGLRATAAAHAFQGAKGGATFWRVKVSMPKIAGA